MQKDDLGRLQAPPTKLRGYHADHQPVEPLDEEHVAAGVLGVQVEPQGDAALVAELEAFEGVTIEKPGGTFYSFPDFSTYDKDSVALSKFILDKVQVTLYSKQEDVDALTERARAEYKTRDERVDTMTDEDVDTFYSCTLCQSFAPSHVCVITPERIGMCGAYNWLDGKASYQINPTGPNQPIDKGECTDPDNGYFTGINEFVSQASRGAVPEVSCYSLMNNPMTACGCFEAIAAMLPQCNGIMVVNRDYMGMTPSGMKFTTLAGVMGGGASSPGFVGHSKFNITQGKFIVGDGGLARMVWMPKILKEEIKERLLKRGKELGIPDLIDRIADETVGITEEEILPFLQEKKHPALDMDPIIG